MKALWNRPMSPTGRSGSQHLWVVGALCLSLVGSGCSIQAGPELVPARPGPVGSGQPLGYVVCPTSVTPVELGTRTAEAPITLPIRGTPPLGSFAVATSPDGRSAYVVTSSTTRAGTVDNVVVPIDLATQRAQTPIVLPGRGGTHAVVVMHDGKTVLAASGTTIVPVDAAHRSVGTPLDLGSGRTAFSMALSPTSPVLYVLVEGGVLPVDTATATVGSMIPTGLSISSVSSPHGVIVAADGATVYAVGHGGADFGGRMVSITVATGAVGSATSFDKFGIADPAALAMVIGGATILMADSGNNWVVPIPIADLATPSGPVRLPSGGGVAAGSPSGHPSDIVVGPGATGAFVVAGLNAVLPFDPTTNTFGRAVKVCSGAASMAVAGA